MSSSPRSAGRGRAVAGPETSGLLLVDKPLGVTSHDVVAHARRRLGIRGVGHLGTLDPAASGLLVLASYNWGHNNVRKLIQKLPVNPKERNFWRLLKINKVPQQTYDYVYYVFSAAVIGENPSLFGFGFKNPLKSVEES